MAAHIRSPDPAFRAAARVAIESSEWPWRQPTEADVLEWLSQNSNAVSAMANLGMLAVWLFYAQLLYSGYRRERRSHVLINNGIGSAGLDSPCLICNMSREPIFVEGIFVELESDERTWSAPVTQVEERSDDRRDTVGARAGQGPLDSGDCIQTLSFRTLLQCAIDPEGRESPTSDTDTLEPGLRSLTVTVVSLYGPDYSPFGAARKFELQRTEDGRVKLKPTSVDTVRLISRRGRKQARELLSRAT